MLQYVDMRDNSFQSFLEKQGSLLRPYIRQTWMKYCKDFAVVDNETSARIQPFANFLTAGKLLRGSLTLLSADMFGLEYNFVLPIAASLEFIQSFLLVHDDIMDKSSKRRGMDSIHSYFARLTRDKDAQHSGISQAICLGDIAYLCSQDLIARSELSPEQHKQISGLIAREIMLVATAQMLDLRMGHSERSREEIYTLYQYKTARYTVSLPLLVGAVLTNAPEKVRRQIDAFGESLGILFQIQDDLLDVSLSDTGKNKGSDILLQKHTIVKLVLEECEHPGANLFKRNNFSAEELPLTIKYIRQALAEKKVAAKIDAHITYLSEKAEQSLYGIAQCGIDTTLCGNFLEYCRERKH